MHAQDATHLKGGHMSSHGYVYIYTSMYTRVDEYTCTKLHETHKNIHVNECIKDGHDYNETCSQGW